MGCAIRIAPPKPILTSSSTVVEDLYDRDSTHSSLLPMDCPKLDYLWNASNGNARASISLLDISISKSCGKQVIDLERKLGKYRVSSFSNLSKSSSLPQLYFRQGSTNSSKDCSSVPMDHPQPIASKRNPMTSFSMRSLLANSAPPLDTDWTPPISEWNCDSSRTNSNNSQMGEMASLFE